MATTYQVQPPDQFTFSRPDDWPKWARRFERFRTAEKDGEVQVNMLLYTMVDEADDILRSFKLSEADQKDYDTVKPKLDWHFVKKHNVIYEHAWFNMRKQEEGETVDSFITLLYVLAEHCTYGSLHDEMIRDRLVVGLGSAVLSEKLQLDSELTLEKAVTQAHLQEAVKLQQSVVRVGTRMKPDTPVSVVSQVEPHQQSGGRANRPRESRGPRTLSNNQSNGACSKCGLTPLHDSARCQAREAVCRRCKKRGHYQSL